MAPSESDFLPRAGRLGLRPFPDGSGRLETSLMRIVQLAGSFARRRIGSASGAASASALRGTTASRRASSIWDPDDQRRIDRGPARVVAALAGGHQPAGQPDEAVIDQSGVVGGDFAEQVADPPARRVVHRDRVGVRRRSAARG